MKWNEIHNWFCLEFIKNSTFRLLNILKFSFFFILGLLFFLSLAVCVCHHFSQSFGTDVLNKLNKYVNIFMYFIRQ